MNQSEAQREEESTVFEAFLSLQPEFAGDWIEEWHVADADPPDIICTSASGKTIGVELGEWLHEKEIGAGKLRERIEQQLIDAIGEPQPLNSSQHFDMVAIHPRDKVRLKLRPEQIAFRAALFELIDEVDRRWLSERSWHSPQGCHINDLTPWPPLDKYLKQVQFNPGHTKWAQGINWIVPPAHGDSFDEKTMAEPLVQLIRGKISRYQARQMATPSDELMLLIFFNQGLMYNSPIETPRRPIANLAEDVRRRFASGHDPFQRAFLFLAPSPGEQVFRLW
jgi:hypothetical protein